MPRFVIPHDEGWKVIDCNFGSPVHYVMWADPVSHQIGACMCAAMLGIQPRVPLGHCTESECQPIDVPKVVIEHERKTVLINLKEENKDEGLWSTTIRKNDLEAQSTQQE